MVGVAGLGVLARLGLSSFPVLFPWTLRDVARHQRLWNPSRFEFRSIRGIHSHLGLRDHIIRSLSIGWVSIWICW